MECYPLFNFCNFRNVIIFKILKITAENNHRKIIIFIIKLKGDKNTIEVILSKFNCA